MHASILILVSEGVFEGLCPHTILRLRILSSKRCLHSTAFSQLDNCSPTAIIIFQLSAIQPLQSALDRIGTVFYTASLITCYGFGRYFTCLMDMSSLQCLPLLWACCVGV
jgi:hypothetical protein